MALRIQCTKAFVKAIICGITFKLVLIVNELFPELPEDGYSMLLLDQCHKVKWLTKIEGRGNLEGEREDREGWREREMEREREREEGGRGERERERERREEKKKGEGRKRQPQEWGWDKHV